MDGWTNERINQSVNDRSLIVILISSNLNKGGTKLPDVLWLLQERVNV